MNTLYISAEYFILHRRYVVSPLLGAAALFASSFLAQSGGYYLTLATVRKYVDLGIRV